MRPQLLRDAQCLQEQPLRTGLEIGLSQRLDLRAVGFDVRVSAPDQGTALVDVDPEPEDAVACMYS